MIPATMWKRLIALCTAATVVSLVMVPLSALADTADDITDLEDEAADVFADTDDSLGETEVEDISDDFQNIYNDVIDEVEGAGSISSSACDDIEDAADSFIDRINLLMISIGSAATDAADDEFEEMDSDLDNLEDDLEEEVDSLDCDGTGSGSSSSSSDVDDVISELEDILDNLIALDDDISDIDDASTLTSFFNDIKDELDDATDEVESITETLSSSDHDNLEDAVTDITDEVSDLVDSVESEIASSLDDDFADESEDNDTEVEELEDALDDVDETSSSGSSSTSSSGSLNIGTVTNTIIDYTDDEIDRLEREDAPDVNSSQANFDDWEDEMIDILSSILDDIQDIGGTITASQIDDLESAVDDLESAVDDAVQALDEDVSSSLQDDVDDLTDDVDDLLADIQTATDDVVVSSGSTTTTTTTASGSCFDISASEDEIADLLDRAETLESDATDTNSSSEYDDFVAEMKDVANDTLDLIEGIDDKRVTGNNLTTLSDSIQDVEDQLDDAWDELSNEGSGYSTDEFSDDESDIEDILDDIDDTFNDFADTIPRCSAVSTYAPLPTPTGAPQPASPTIRFRDVARANEFYNFVESLAAAGILNGYSDQTYRPKNSITRAEWLKISINAAGIDTSGFNGVPAYSDVPANHSLKQYINYAAATGLLTPLSSGLFQPETPITRADAVMVTLKVFGQSVPSVNSSYFRDVTNLEQARYINAASDSGIISGYAPGLFGPTLSVNRGEAAKIISGGLQRFITLY